MKKKTPLDAYKIKFLNESGETIPGFAVMQVSGWEVDRAGQDYVKVTKPDGNGEVFLLNSPFPVADDKIGRATDESFCYALYDDADTPAVDEAWGPEADSWKLKKDNSGFFIVGDEKGAGANARVRVALSSSGGGSASAGWGKVIAYGESTGITAADLVGVPEVSPPMVGWGYINPANLSDPTDGIDDEPDSPDNLLFEVDDTKQYVVYNMTLGEILVTEGVDVYVQWKTLEPEGKRWVDVESCVTVPE
jgi:hypothetical protein